VASDAAHPRDKKGLGASTVAVATGMLTSRLAGFVRTILFTQYFGGHTVAADAFNAAIRIPNFLQNLLGDGAMSASLIPVYVGLLAKDRQQDADRIARAVLGVLALVTSLMVLAGVLWTSAFVDLFAAGFTGERRSLTIEIVRVLFPGIGLLVISAWCLAVLNSHRRFLLGYVAPVFWNLAMIAALVFGHHTTLPTLAVRLAWGSVAGSVLQLGVQVPTVWALMSGSWRGAAAAVTGEVRRVLVNALPVIFARGVVQVSAYIDTYIASWLPLGAVSALYYAQLLYSLPVSLFGMAVAAAALPSMSAVASDSSFTQLRSRLSTSRQIVTVLVVPSTFAFFAFGDVIISALFQHGAFDRGDTLYAWSVLAGSAVGLLATTVGRLYSSAFYALGDTRTPTVFATIRVTLVIGLGIVSALYVPGWIGIEPRWGAAGLTVSAGIAGWVEFTLLSRGLKARVGSLGSHTRFAAKTWAAVLVAGAMASSLRLIIPVNAVITRGVVILGVYGILVLASLWRMRLFETGEILKRLYALKRGRS
jgi:putative peptidoglycan lipid II flippase